MDALETVKIYKLAGEIATIAVANFTEKMCQFTADINQIAADYEARRSSVSTEGAVHEQGMSSAVLRP